MQSVKSVRLLRGYTQEELARLIGISPRAYAFKERGRSSWYFREIYKIAKLCDFPIQEIETLDMYE